MRFLSAILVAELSRGKRGCFFEESTELLLFIYKQTLLMARYNVENVWNDSGSEGSISNSDHTPENSNSDSESEEWSGDSAET